MSSLRDGKVSRGLGSLALASALGPVFLESMLGAQCGEEASGLEVFAASAALVLGLLAQSGVDPKVVALQVGGKVELQVLAAEVYLPEDFELGAVAADGRVGAEGQLRLGVLRALVHTS